MKDSPQEQQAEGLWKQFRGKVQETWGTLTGDTLDRFEGKKDQLIGFIQEKTGETREEIRDTLQDLQERTEYWFGEPKN